jgi:uncharacterized protein (TIGR02145 family)
MKNYKIVAALFLLCILFSCDKYDLLRNNPKDPKGTGYKPSFKLTTNDATAVTITTATSGGKITSDAGVIITAKGVCWGTAANPTVALTTKTNDGTGLANYTSNITGLTGSTTYYVRAYATTSTGTVYGDNSITFTTLAVHTAPVLTTTAASAVGLTNAYSGGTITSNGGDPITARGVVWGTSANPTIALTTKTVDDSTSVGTFSNKMTPLTAGTTYHVRAYATNVVGTGYGSDLTFTTLTVPVNPTVTTTAVSVYAITTAVSGGNISFDGGADVTDRGVCWSTLANPTIALGTKTSDGPGTGIFTSYLTGLSAGLTYHVRAFATTSAGTGYGADMTFTTNTVASVPTVTTSAVTDILLYTATGGGNVISDGGASVTTRGICWATTVNPTTSNSKINNGSGTGVFTCSLNLNLNTTYHIRAYATNSVGTSYGADVTFTTLATAAVPTLSTTTVTAITPNSATSGGNITSDGGASVTARGVCWSTSANPSLPTTAKTSDSNGTGTYVSNITGLTGGTLYHVRAYATNSAGTGYGPDITFTTSPITYATINTTAITANVGITATSGGTISSDGGSAITQRGVCWGTTLNPQITDSKTTEGPGSGTFVSNLIGLTIGTNYHVRAYATNSAGTAYGQDIAFSTPNIAVLTTSPITSITPISATSGGNITSDGGAPVTESGVCWSTSTNPTIALSTKVAGTTSSGTFYSYMTGLSGSTTYYVRAYATNSVGTAYGLNVTFTTSPPVVPVVTTTSLSAITVTTAVSGGEITSNGGAAITARGVCWNTVTAPTISNSKTNDGTTFGIFTSNLTSLAANTTYYLRAYATNIAGTSYGSEIVFKTAYGTVTDADGNTYYTIGIGSQVWMRENLKTTKYRDGNLITNITDNTAWSSLTYGAYSWYSNDVANKPIYGALYNWYATTDSRGLCPTSWHVPTDAEWTTLATTLGGSSVAGGKMREPGTAHWVGTDATATNESGFTALGNGYRTYSGTFTQLGIYNYTWSSTEYANPSYGYGAYLYYYGGQLVTSQPLQKTYGNSVRCIKD